MTNTKKNKAVRTPILITGANRGLGLKICKKLSHHYDIYATARDIEKLQSAFDKESIELKCGYTLDSALPCKEVIDDLFKDQVNFSAIIHCASPYVPKKFKDNDFDELSLLANCTLSDQYLLKKSAEHLQSTNGCLLVTGSVIGLPNWYGLGAMGIYKNNLRQLCGILSYEYKDKVYIVHLNLGAFRDNVDNEYADSQTRTHDIVYAIEEILNKPSKHSPTVNLVSQKEAKYFNIEPYKLEI